MNLHGSTRKISQINGVRVFDLTFTFIRAKTSGLIIITTFHDTRRQIHPTLTMQLLFWFCHVDSLFLYAGSSNHKSRKAAGMEITK